MQPHGHWGLRNAIERWCRSAMSLCSSTTGCPGPHPGHPLFMHAADNGQDDIQWPLRVEASKGITRDGGGDANLSLPVV
jgi:hypothetical protein